MAFRRIEDSELVGKGNVGQPDTPGVSTSEMQRIMDEIPREIIVPAFNELSDQLSDASSAASLGASVPSGVSASKNVQSVIQGVLNLLNSHKSDTNNPHTTTASQVGAYSKGEADQKVQNAVSAHSDRTDNPHAVTAAQTGAYTKAETEAAINQKVVEIGTGDMAKAEYARNGKEGVVDRAEHLDYRVGDTITTTDESFDPNTAIGGTWTKNVVYTKDVPFTQITPPEGVTVQSAATTGYLVRNGICFLYMDVVRSSKAGPIALDIPRAAIQVAQYTTDGQSLFIPLSYGYIQANGPINGHSVTLSYPVLDNDVTKAYVWSKTA